MIRERERVKSSGLRRRERRAVVLLLQDEETRRERATVPDRAVRLAICARESRERRGHLACARVNGYIQLSRRNKRTRSERKNEPPKKSYLGPWARCARPERRRSVARSLETALRTTADSSANGPVVSPPCERTLPGRTHKQPPPLRERLTFLKQNSSAPT